MKVRLDEWFKNHLHGRLCNPIGCRRNAQRACRSRVALWNLDEADQWWKIATRRHLVPDLVKIILRVILERRQRVAINPCRPIDDYALYERVLLKPDGTELDTVEIIQDDEFVRRDDDESISGGKQPGEEADEFFALLSQSEKLLADLFNTTAHLVRLEAVYRSAGC
jgi:hypothetical protein